MLAGWPWARLVTRGLLGDWAGLPGGAGGLQGGVAVISSC